MKKKLRNQKRPSCRLERLETRCLLSASSLDFALDASEFYPTPMQGFPQIPLTNDEAEPNDTFDQTFDLGSENQTLVGLSIDSPDDVDLFEWTAPARGILAVDLFFEQSQGDLELAIFKDEQPIDWSLTTTNNEEVAHPVLPGDSLVIQVHGHHGSTNPDYDLVVRLNPETPRVYAAAGDQVAIFELDGSPAGAFMHPAFDGGQISDVEINKNGLVYVGVTQGPFRQLIEFTADGSFSRQLDLPQTLIVDIATNTGFGFDILDDDSILIGSSQNFDEHQLLQISQKQNLMAALPTEGAVLDVTVRTDEQIITSFNDPFFGYVNSTVEGNIWNAFPLDHFVQLVDAESNELLAIPLGNDLFPVDVQQSLAGEIFVISRTATNQTLLQKFDHDGQFEFEIPLLGLPGGLAIYMDDRPARVPMADTDGDSLFDDWEINGIDIDNDGVIDIDLPAMGADPLHKDIFVEVDAMLGRAPELLTDPIVAVEDKGLATGTILDRVVESFLNAPVFNPDGESGINLHIQVDQTDLPVVEFSNRWEDFANIKAGKDADQLNGTFGTDLERADPNWPSIREAKRHAFRYGMFADRIAGTSQSGLAELPGNDFYVTLGAWPVEGGTADQKTGTFMHELGHNLGLRHGGGDNVNFKPNYFSVMNYHWQIPHGQAEGWELNYSDFAYSSLDELELAEGNGVGLPAGQNHETRLVPVGPLPFDDVPLVGPVDWTGDGDSIDIQVVRDLNRGFADTNNDGLVNEEDESAGEFLHGHNDWQAIRYWFRDLQNFGEFGDGIDSPYEVPDRDHSDIYDLDPPDFTEDGPGGNNDTQENAYCISDFTSFFGLTIDSPGDVDWFKIAISAPVIGVIAINPSILIGAGLLLTVVDDAGETLAASQSTQSGESSVASISFEAGRTYFIRVEPLDQSSHGVYNLSIDTGDMNLDGIVDVHDLDRLCSAIANGSRAGRLDLNGDREVDKEDRDIMLASVFQTVIGDSNLDGIFNSSDMIRVFSAGEYEDDLIGNSTWSTGDWNCDGEFNSVDFIEAFSAGTYTRTAMRSMIGARVSLEFDLDDKKRGRHS